MIWFSATVRVVCLIETVGSTRYMDSVHLLQADDFDGAFRRALEVGRLHEESYVNGDGQRVLWRLASIVTLDMLGEGILDGVEVCSGPVDLSDDERTPFDHVFSPELSKPTQTI